MLLLWQKEMMRNFNVKWETQSIFNTRIKADLGNECVKTEHWSCYQCFDQNRLSCFSSEQAPKWGTGWREESARWASRAWLWGSEKERGEAPFSLSRSQMVSSSYTLLGSLFTDYYPSNTKPSFESCCWRNNNYNDRVLQKTRGTREKRFKS